MRELKQDWRDIFGSFRVAFDVWKLLPALAGIVVTYLVIWGLTSIPAAKAYGPGGWIIALGVAVLVLIGLGVKFLRSDTGFTGAKAVMLLLVGVLLAGGVLLCVFTDTARYWGWYGGIVLAVLVIWAFFGGTITRIASVEIASDDRIGLGEAASFACRKYGAYLGATVLPVVAVLFLALCCTVFGLLFRMHVVDLVVTVLFFFLVPIAGFLMFLIGFGGVVGSPLMYPAVSSEGNDSFDAISRAYSYVLGRPWRYIFYNAAALVYGTVCTFFVAVFARYMIRYSFAAVNYGTGGHFKNIITPRLNTLLNPAAKAGCGILDTVGAFIARWDVTEYVNVVYTKAQGILGLTTFQADKLDLTWYTATAAVIIAIGLYVVIGLVAAYAVSLFFSMQTTIYLLLRKAVDGAEMTEVYREEEEDYLTVAPEEEPPAETPPVEEEKAEETEEKKPKKKKKAKEEKSESDFEV